MRSSLHIYHINSLWYLRLELKNNHQTGRCVFLQCEYQFNPSLPIPLNLAQLHLMSLRPLLMSLESLMLQLLGQKLKRIVIVKIGIPLTFLPHPCPEPNFPILHENDYRLTRNSGSNAASDLLLHLFKGSHPMDVRPSGSPPCRSGLKNLVGCYHWFKVQKIRGSTLWWCRRRRTIMLVSRCNHKPAMGSVTGAYNIN